MTAGRSRLMISGCWFGSMVVCLFVVFLGVGLRGDLHLDWQAAFQLSTPLTSLYIPVLTAFAMFWFRPGAAPNNKKLSAEKWIATLAITSFFQMFVVAGTIGIVLFSKPSPDSSSGLFEEVAGLVHFMSIFSPLATAPVAYMLGIEKIDSK